MLGPGSGVNLTSDTDKPRPPAHNIAAPPAAVGGRNVNSQITGFHGLGDFLQASMGLSEVESFRK